MRMLFALLLLAGCTSMANTAVQPQAATKVAPATLPEVQLAVTNSSSLIVSVLQGPPPGCGSLPPLSPPGGILQPNDTLNMSGDNDCMENGPTTIQVSYKEELAWTCTMSISYNASANDYTFAITQQGTSTSCSIDGAEVWVGDSANLVYNASQPPGVRRSRH